VTYQSEKGENDWSEILRHVDLIVTAPSTVSLEGMFYNKPIVNFLFDESNLENTKTVSILNTRFYSSILNSKNLILVNDKSQFKALLLDFNTLEFGEVELPSIVEGNNSFNSYSFYSEILNLNNGLCD
jgi:CDP-glycerol glycerophosphotransferase (TagB/SpsB family)